jgi:hypothetical protein
MHPFVSWSSAILVEPMFLHPNFLYRTGNFLIESTIKRRDVWHSREEAHKLFRERSLKSWDPRVIDLYVVRIHSMSDVPVILTAVQRYGLRELPTLAYPDKARGVTLKCTKVQETVRYRRPLLPTFLDSHPLQATYGENPGHARSQRSLLMFCKDVPTHVVFGAIPDMLCAFVYF